MSPGRLQGCSRGVFGLASWEPLRKPGEKPNTPLSSTSARAEISTERTKVPVGQAPKPSSAPDRPRTQILAKFNYKKNPASPLGAELNLKQGEKLFYLEVHADNEHWWLAEDNNGDVGYVPAGYLMVIEEVHGLPWLQNREEEIPQEAPVVRKPSAPENFYCEVCERKFNGPRPYAAHMASKGHKEELMLAEENY